MWKWIVSKSDAYHPHANKLTNRNVRMIQLDKLIRKTTIRKKREKSAQR